MNEVGKLGFNPATSSPSIAIVGGGFGGVGAAAMLRRAGYENVVVFERSERVGGVWDTNTYPGAACDVPSHLYEFSFDPNPRWSRRYAPQAEIQQYLEDVVDRHGLRDQIRTGTEVIGAQWREDRHVWELETSQGTHEAEIMLTACGQLTSPKLPSIPGLDDFAGPAFHTARWEHEVELTGKRVAVLGTGCSAIQVVPAIQPEVAQVSVFQRTPGWTLPRQDFAYSPRVQRLFERFPALQRLDRQAVFAFMELGAMGMTRRLPMILNPMRAAGRHQINKAIKDPDLRRRVTPTDEIGCKRVMTTDEWYPTLTRSNVELVDTAIERIIPNGIRTADGVEHEADVLVLATGFESHDFVAPMEITGTNGRSLAEEWGGSPYAYLGLSVPRFPNMFLLYGPNTNGGTGSVVFTIEAGMCHVLSALEQLKENHASRIEVRQAASDEFKNELRTALEQTVWSSGCSSWYLDENGNNPNQWPWRSGAYKKRTASLRPDAYELIAAGERAKATA